MRNPLTFWNQQASNLMSRDEINSLEADDLYIETWGPYFLTHSGYKKMRKKISQGADINELLRDLRNSLYEKDKNSAYTDYHLM